MILAVIPAKGGSNRLPGKNMLPINGRPLLDYSVDAARASKRVGRIVVSTDDDAIDAHARKLGLEVVRRPESLGGETPIIEVYRHCLNELNDASVTVVVGLQPDHPDRDLSVDETLLIFERDGADRLMSTEANGTKNGAHYVLSRHFVETGTSHKDTVVVDDCTNIHFQADLDRATARLMTRPGQ